MSEQPTPAPGIDIPPAYVIDALRQELASARDENSIMQIKINYLNEAVAILQAQLSEAVNGHTHDSDVPSVVEANLTSQNEMDDTPSE